jgi:hypothetical protein
LVLRYAKARRAISALFSLRTRDVRYSPISDATRISSDPEHGSCSSVTLSLSKGDAGRSIGLALAGFANHRASVSFLARDRRLREAPRPSPKALRINFDRLSVTPIRAPAGGSQSDSVRFSPESDAPLRSEAYKRAGDSRETLVSTRLTIP